LPHKHSPNSKYYKKKRERWKILQEYRSIPKVWDPVRAEVIACGTTKNFLQGEVLKSPRHISPQLDEFRQKSSKNMRRKSNG